jgi:putative oxidoreductase
MSTLSISLALAIRVVLVLLFLPFSALDKILDFRNAVAQAQEAVQNEAAATALILIGLFVEVVMSAGVVSGIADRACAFVLAGYCAVTALVWKQFWRPGDFWRSSDGKARALFWDFWKNLALAAGFLLIVFGTDASSIAQFFAHPTIQSHPYPTYTGARTAVSTESSLVVPYWHVWTDADGISHRSTIWHGPAPSRRLQRASSRCASVKACGSTSRPCRS